MVQELDILEQFQQVGLVILGVTPQGLAPCPQEAPGTQQQGRAIQPGGQVTQQQARAIQQEGYHQPLGIQLGGLHHPAVPQATPPHPNHLTPRHQVEVIQ